MPVGKSPSATGIAIAAPFLPCVQYHPGLNFLNDTKSKICRSNKFYTFAHNLAQIWAFHRPSKGTVFNYLGGGTRVKHILGS